MILNQKNGKTDGKTLIGERNGKRKSKQLIHKMLIYAGNQAQTHVIIDGVKDTKKIRVRTRGHFRGQPNGTLTEHGMGGSEHALAG